MTTSTEGKRAIGQGSRGSEGVVWYVPTILVANIQTTYSMPCSDAVVLPLPHVAILVSHYRCTLARAQSALANEKGVLMLLSL
eukprot:5472-Heterococcus_DN1.PRE.2